MYWRVMGMHIGKNTLLPRVYVTWPHKIRLGANCCVEHGVYFHFDGIYSEGPGIIIRNNCFVGAGTEFNIRDRIEIGPDCLIASGCRFIDHNHGTQAGQLMRLQSQPTAAILVGADVWIGANAVILKGVQIGDGAIIGAGSVVTKSIPAHAVAVGIPAHVVTSRQQE
jgi:acetyltransferase-like isoleucine patch superfamily enzyme